MKKLLLGLTLLASMSSFASADSLLESARTSFSNENCSVEATLGGDFKMELNSGRVIQYHGDLKNNTESEVKIDLETKISHHKQGENVISAFISEISADKVKMESTIRLIPETGNYEAIVVSRVNGVLNATKCLNLKKD